MKQLALSIPLRDHSDFANYYISTENSEPATAVRNAACHPDGSGLLIVGEQGSGRSHLLEAACLLAGEKKLSALYLPLQDLRNTAEPEVLQALESVSLLAIDDVDCIAGDRDWEEALFHCYNRATQAQQTLIFSSSAPPASIPFSLKDLGSRLAASLVYQLVSLSDEQRSRCLQQRAENLGLNISDEVAGYILSRARRGMSSLVNIVEVLDRESLSAQRRVTIPFVKKIFSW